MQIGVFLYSLSRDKAASAKNGAGKLDRFAMEDGMNGSQISYSDELMPMESLKRMAGRWRFSFVGLLLCGIYAAPSSAVDCCDATYKGNPECRGFRDRCQAPRSSPSPQATERQTPPSSGSTGGGYSSGNTYRGSTPSIPTYSVPSPSGGGSDAAEVLGILGTFLEIWGNAQQQEAQRAQEEYQRSQAEQQQLEEEEEERRAQQLEDRRKRQAMTNPFAPSASPNSDVRNPFATTTQANRETPERGTIASNPFRPELAQGPSSSGIPKEQCISDLQRALLATKKAYLKNTKGATTLNDKSISADFEIPRSSCPPVSKVNVYEQRRTFEDARALQYCASQALKCAIILVDQGADCQTSMSSCQTKFVGNLK